MSSEKRDFNSGAASWDSRPTRVKLADDVADAIIEQIAITSDMDVLDFGCGTGLLTLRLQPLVGSITGVDSSPGMLEVFNAKIGELQLANVKALLCDLDKGDTIPGRYDLIVSSMTLHHVREIKPLLTLFHSLLNPGGILCLADLDLDNGLFHNDNTGVFHHGFDRNELRNAFLEAGFIDVREATAAEIVKEDRNGETRRFTVLLMTGHTK
jgi:2-polyprenyl-3-methyl-5-hydroxy-6-metoxy-1,4-benzoquinol methylase